jgi:hypothetical protein
MFSPARRVRKPERLRLAVWALLLSRLQGAIPDGGIVYLGPDCATTNIRFGTALPAAENELRDAERLQRATVPPQLLLNDHCRICEFHERWHGWPDPGDACQSRWLHHRNRAMGTHAAAVALYPNLAYKPDVEATIVRSPRGRTTRRRCTVAPERCTSCSGSKRPWKAATARSQSGRIMSRRCRAPALCCMRWNGSRRGARALQSRARGVA